MSTTITQQPDALSFSGNLKTFEVTISGTSLTFVLKKAGVTVLSEKYYPAAGKVTIDVRQVVERLLEIAVPTTSGQVTEQTAGVADFTATIDSETPIPFTVVKGGVANLDTDAATWMAAHLLSWQPGTKEVLTSQPEYIGIYTQAETVLKLIAYDIDGTNVEATYATLAADKLHTVRTDWVYIVSLMAGLGATENVFAWTIYVDGANYETQRQTYQLRAPDTSASLSGRDRIFAWANSLGGIDTFYATGSVDDNPKLEHKTAISVADLTSEYDVIENREFKQSTGYLDEYSAAWLKDFFYSTKKYKVEIVSTTTTFRQIAALTSDIVVSSLNDLTDYSFAYRLSENTKLLNLEREFIAPTDIEGIEELFSAQRVDELIHTDYQDHLKILVRRPDSEIWEFIYADELGGGDGYENWQMSAPSEETIVNGGMVYNAKCIYETYNNSTLLKINPIHTTKASIPTSMDWKNMINYLGGFNVAMPKLKSVGTDYWNNATGTDDYGFNAKGAGYIDPDGDIGFYDEGGVLIEPYKKYYAAYHSVKGTDAMEPNRFFQVVLDDASDGIGTNGGWMQTYGANIRLVINEPENIVGNTGTYMGNDGRVYKCVLINEVWWLAENLAETQFRDGTPIEVITNKEDWVVYPLTPRAAYIEYNIDNVFETQTVSKTITINSQEVLNLEGEGITFRVDAVTKKITIVGATAMAQIDGLIAAIATKQSIALSYVSITDGYTLDDANDIVECTSGTFTVTPHSAATAVKKRYNVVNTGTGEITVAGEVLAQGESVTLFPNGTTWLIL